MAKTWVENYLASIFNQQKYYLIHKDDIKNKNCNWNIYAPIGDTIKLQVTSFLLEGGDKI